MTEEIKKREKIIYCITKSVFGGAGRYVLDLSTAIPKDEFDAVVALGGKGILVEKLKERGIRTIPLRSAERDLNFTKDIKVFQELHTIFKIEKPDIVHLNSSKIGGVGALAARLVGIKKIIFTVHGWPFNENRNIFSKFIIWIASWITALLSTHIIAIDEHDLRQGKKLPFCKNKVFLVHNGIHEFKAVERKEAKKIISEKIGHDIFKNKISIATIAELHKNKGLEYGIEAISRLPQKIQKKITYTIIGEGEQRSYLEKMISKYNLKNVVFLMGFIDDAKKYLSAFEIFMLPSLKEGLPYVLLEAGFIGLPLITTKVGGIPDIIGDTKSNFLVESRRSDNLCMALMEIINNRKVRNTLGKKNQINIKTKFCFEKMLNGTIKVYRN